MSLNGLICIFPSFPLRNVKARIIVGEIARLLSKVVVRCYTHRQCIRIRISSQSHQLSLVSDCARECGAVPHCVLIYIFLKCITFWIIGSVRGNGEKKPKLYWLGSSYECSFSYFSWGIGPSDLRMGLSLFPVWGTVPHGREGWGPEHWLHLICSREVGRRNAGCQFTFYCLSAECQLREWCPCPSVWVFMLHLTQPRSSLPVMIEG